jgi:lipopolysaccharide transport system ATP-binding protein
MSEPAISVRNLGKRYHIGRKKEGYKTLRESLVSLVKAPYRRFRPRSKRTGNDFIWALKDVSFDVANGEVVGIIGRNGAGKSTLLKILSRITEPTEGEAIIRGRVGSLLEVGTGFHPELTGRENIYLNGAILGMRRGEIARKFDEMVAFSEVEQFIDTPVKHYSSGMYLRLAFAVAAHLEPEVLLVDEVLAVGDAIFQKKCLGKMGEVAQQGRTVFFVSHNMAAIQTLCPRVLLLRQGGLVMDASAEEAIGEYLGYLFEGAATAYEDNPERSGRGDVRLTGGSVLDATGQAATHLVAGQPATFEFTYRNHSGADRIDFLMTIVNHLGVSVAHFSTVVSGFVMSGLGEEGTIVCRLPNLPLPLGQYRIAIAVRYRGESVDVLPNALAFSVESSVFFESGRVPSIQYASCLLDHRWEHRANVLGLAEQAPRAVTSENR